MNLGKLFKKAKALAKSPEGKIAIAAIGIALPVVAPKAAAKVAKVIAQAKGVKGAAKAL